MKWSAIAAGCIGTLTFGAHAADIGALPSPLIAPPAPAERALSGVLSIYGGAGMAHENQGVGSDSTFGFGGASGRLNVWLHQSFSAQGDLEGEASTGLSTALSGDGLAQAIVGGHLSWRDPSSTLIGVFAGLTTESNPGIGGGLHAHGEQWLAGVEGQVYLGNATFYGQAGYAGTIAPTGGPCCVYGQDLAFGRLVGRYFVTPNDKIQAEVGFAAGTFTGNGTAAQTWTWGALYEHQFADHPFAGFVEYAGLQNSAPNISNVSTEHRVMAGLNFRFGQQTLMGEDRNGATLDMPTGLVRSLAWSYWNY